jgi:hypothetical protein
MKELKFITNEEALQYLKDGTLDVQQKKNISLALDAKDRIYLCKNKAHRKFSSEKDLYSMAIATLKIIKSINLGFVFSAALFIYFSFLEIEEHGRIDDYSSMWILIGVYSFLYLFFISQYKKYAHYSLKYISEVEKSQKSTQ